MNLFSTFVFCQFDRDGYVVINNFLNEKEVKDLKEAGEKLTQNVPLNAKTVFTTSQTSQVNNNDVSTIEPWVTFQFIAFARIYKGVVVYLEYYSGRKVVHFQKLQSPKHIIIFNVFFQTIVIICNGSQINRI